VRYRGYPLADIERTQHQQKFLAALLHEVTQPSAVLKLPVLVPELYRCVKTNLSLSQLYQLAQAARKLAGSKMLAQTLPGYPVMIDDVSYWAVDPAEAKLALGRLLNGETTEVVRSAPVNPNALGAATQSPSRPKEEPSVGANKPGAAGSTGSGPVKPPESAKNNPAGTGAKKAESDKAGKGAPAGTAPTAGKGTAENKTSAAPGGPGTPQTSPPLIPGAPRQPATAP
jgi:hypothetical protein